MTTINELPDEIFNYIKEYTNINNLIKTCKFFYQFKKDLYYWKLTIEYSIKFYYNIGNFREELILLISSQNKQLSINFSACDVNTLDLIALKNVHMLRIYY